MDAIKIIISVPVDGAVHEHAAYIQYNGVDADVMAYDAISQFLLLSQSVFGELDTQDAIEQIKKEW